MSMTYEATVELVLDHLRQTAGEWRVKPAGWNPMNGRYERPIRRDLGGDDTCPVVAAVGHRGSSLVWARRRQINYHAACRLAAAADGNFWGDRQAIQDLRRRMLEAAGLEEAAA